MSGIVGSKLNIRGSGRIAKLGTDGQALTSSGVGVTAAFEDLAGGISWQSVVTGSTMTAVAGNGYPIDTTSNACTITLPASASNGDEIIFTDYARNWGTNGIEIDSNGLNYQTQDDTYTVEYGTDGQAVHIVYFDATNGWIPILDKAVTDAPSKGNDEGIFGFGFESAGSGSARWVSMTNLVSNTGVVSTDVTGVGTAKQSMEACEYGGDKGIFGFGQAYGASANAETNLVSNTGVVSSDVAGVGTARMHHAACGYGEDKGIFGFGYYGGTYTAVTNLVSNAGVVATDVAGVGTVRMQLMACEYGEDKGIFGYGIKSDDSRQSMTNLVSNVGVVSSDVTGVGTGRDGSGAACGYGEDKGIFGFGNTSGGSVSMTNLVSNAGVVATDTTGVGTARYGLSACEYGGDKGIFGFGHDGSNTAVTNLVSNVGVVASDVTGVGTARTTLAACSFN